LDNSVFNFEIIPVPEALNLEKLQSGKNHKKFLVLLRTEGDPEARINFLQKVLSAIDIDLHEDTVFIDLPIATKVNISDLINEFSPQSCLIFGIAPQQLGIRFPLPLYQLVEHQTCRYLRADKLKEIHEERQRGEKEKSIRLWKSLQEL
jgi:hypothetical protein